MSVASYGALRRSSAAMSRSFQYGALPIDAASNLDRR
jgi:hypothetical protein